MVEDFILNFGDWTAGFLLLVAKFLSAHGHIHRLLLNFWISITAAIIWTWWALLWGHPGTAVVYVIYLIISIQGIYTWRKYLREREA